MNRITILLTSAALFVAGVIGITLSVPLQAPAVILLGLAAIFASAQVLKSGSREVLESKPSTWLLWAVMVAIGYFVVRAWMSPVLDLGIEDLMLILPAGLLYLIAGHAVAGKSGARFRQGLAWVVVLLLLMHLGSCLLQLGGGDGYSLSMFLTSASRASDGVVTGMYGYYGSFANFAVIAGMLCLSLGVWGRSGWVIRGLFLLLGLAALAFAVWSQSRSAVVSLVPALVVFGLLVSVSLAKQRAPLRHRARVLLVVLGLSGLIVGVVGGVWVFKSRVTNESISGADVAFDAGVRMPFWSMAAEQWVDHPIAGAGSRSYSYESFRYWSPNLATGEANPEFVHNEYLQLLADYGLIGLLCVLILIIGHLMVGVKRVKCLSARVGEDGMRVGSNAMALAIAGVCGMTAMAVHITFDFRTHLLANLLLLVCCAVWVLPVAKSTVWKSGSRGVWKSRMGSCVLALVMMVMGLGAIGMGGMQLWGGLPLLQNKVAKEDGAWIPQEVDRDVWIPMLEESVRRSPNWRRYQRLGTLYRIEAGSLEGNEQEDAIEKAKVAYLASVERHAHNPIPWINLASIYSEERQYEKADEAYAKASEMAKARESWFRMHSLWAAMHQRWAAALWQENESGLAEEHFLRAIELYNLSYEYAYAYQNRRWVVDYTRLLIAYARFLDDQGKYDEAELLFQEGRKQVNWHNWQVDTKLNFYYAQHFYEQGKHVWYQRKPEQAYQLMKKARGQLRQHKAMMKNDVEAGYDEQLAKIQKVINFLEKTGVGK